MAVTKIPKGIELITQFVRGQFAKRSAKKTGIASLKKASDSIVQSNAKSIEIILKDMGVDINKLKSTDDVLKHMNIHKAMMDQSLKQEFKGLGLGKGIKSLEKKDPFQGFTPKIVKDKTLLKDSPEQIAKIKAENKAAVKRLQDKKKDRVATADELEDYIETLDPTGETGVVEEGMTIRQLDDMVAEQKAYEAAMYRDYKAGKLDPVAGDKSPARKRFLEKKLEEMELSGDKRLMTREEIEELSSFDLGTEMDEAIKKSKTLTPEDELRKEFPGIDDRMIKNILADTNPQRIAEVKQTMREYLKLREVGKSEQEAYDIITKSIKKPTKHAEGGRIGMMYGGDPGFAFEYGGSWADWRDKHQHQMPVTDYIKTKLPKERLPFRDMQEGGIARAGFPFGGQALKAIRKAWRANKDWGVGGPPYKPEATSFNIKEMTKRNLGEELSLKELKKLSGSPVRPINAPKFEEFNQEFKNIKAQILKEKMMERKLEAKAAINAAEKTMKEAIADPQKYGGNLEMSRRITDQMIRESKETLKEVREGLKEIDIYMGMLQKEGRSVHQSGGLAYMLGEPTYMKYEGGGSVGHAPWHKPTGQPQPQQQLDTPTPQIASRPDPLKAPRGIPSVAPKNMDPQFMQQQMMQKAMMGRGNTGQGPRTMANEGGIMRMGFKKGGDMSRRGFMKLIAGIAALPVIGKYFKLAKPAAKAVEAVVTMEKTAGMPAWFPALVNRVIKQGDDVTKKLGTVEREMVHTQKIKGGEEVTVYRNLDTGNVRVEYADNVSYDPVHLEYKAPEVIESGKYRGKKTNSEFSVSETEPEVVNWDGDIEWSGVNEANKVEDLITDTSKLEEFATGKPLNITKRLTSERKQKYRSKLETDQMEQIDYIEKKRGPFPDPGDYGGGKDEMVEVFEKYRGKASGGLAGLLGE